MHNDEERSKRLLVGNRQKKVIMREQTEEGYEERTDRRRLLGGNRQKKVIRREQTEDGY